MIANGVFVKLTSGADFNLAIACVIFVVTVLNTFLVGLGSCLRLVPVLNGRVMIGLIFGPTLILILVVPSGIMTLSKKTVVLILRWCIGRRATLEVTLGLR